jgi:hypothetical protein
MTRANSGGVPVAVKVWASAVTFDSIPGRPETMRLKKEKSPPWDLQGRAFANAFSLATAERAQNAANAIRCRRTNRLLRRRQEGGRGKDAQHYFRCEFHRISFLKMCVSKALRESIRA